MTTYSAADRVAAMQRAGFPASSIQTGTAVSLAELSTASDVETVFGDNGTSVGIWQIHLPAHPDVTSACAMDLDCSTRAALRISNGGTNWNPWGAFTNGSYRKYLDVASKILGGSPAPATDTGGITHDPGPTDSGSGSGSTSGNASPLSGFQFPTLGLGILGDIAGGVLFKIGLTLLAIGLVFVGLLQLTGVGSVEGKVRP